jgi:hypothetical protein
VGKPGFKFEAGDGVFVVFFRLSEKMQGICLMLGQ